MKRSKRLQPILDLAKLKSNQGLQAVNYVQSSLAQEQDKFQQLLNAREEYKFKNNSNTKQSLNSFSLQSMRRFREGVEIAIEQQARQVAQVESQLEQVRAHWRVLDARSQSLEKTQLRMQGEEYKVQEKKEQSELEEMVTQAHNRRGISAIGPS